MLRRSRANETVAHVITCQNESARLCWSTSIEEVQKWLDKNDAETTLAKHMIPSLREHNKHDIQLQEEEDGLEG